MLKKVLFILSELSTQDIDWLLTHGDRQAVPKGSILIHEGKPIDALYIVLDGTLNVCVAGLGSREIATAKCGEVLGEMSFVDGSPPSATVKALEDSLVLRIPEEMLHEKLAQDTLFSLRFYQAITKLLSYRLRGTFDSFSTKKKPKQDSLAIQSNNETVGANLEVAKAKFDRLIQGIQLPDEKTG